MKIRNLMTIGLMVAGFATMAQAQSYYGGGYSPAGRYAEQRFDNQRFNERRDIGRDLRQRNALLARVEADRQAVNHERYELNHSYGFAAGRESRELRAARERLDCDMRDLRALGGDVNRDFGRTRNNDRY
jgi:hypothetical protein